MWQYVEREIGGKSIFLRCGLVFSASFSVTACRLDDNRIRGDMGRTSDANPACIDDILNSSKCIAAENRYVTAIGSSDVSGSEGSLTVSIPNGYYSGRSCTMSENDLNGGNIKSGVTLFGVQGSFSGSFGSATGSNALRDPGIAANPYATVQTTSTQISQEDEVTTYVGADLPTTGGANYREVPDQATDDEGNLGINCRYAPRPSTDCGIVQASIAARIADCATANPSASKWDGSAWCHRGQGEWILVSRNGANKEVWQDQRTKLLWSSMVTVTTNWCQASGNAQGAPVTFKAAYNNSVGTPIIGNGTIGAITGGSSSAGEDITISFSNATNFTVSGTSCGGGAITAGGLTTSQGSTVTWSRSNFCSFTITQGAVNFAANDKFVIDSDEGAFFSCGPGAAAGLQPASPVSYCAEATGLNATAGENWVTGTYFAAKGRMGKNSTPPVRWRLPTIEDYMTANVNGIRFVLPDMGIVGASRPQIDGSQGGVAAWEWSASVSSSFRYGSWVFNGEAGHVNYFGRVAFYRVRCLGR